MNWNNVLIDIDRVMKQVLIFKILSSYESHYVKSDRLRLIYLLSRLCRSKILSNPYNNLVVCITQLLLSILLKSNIYKPVGF